MKKNTNQEMVSDEIFLIQIPGLIYQHKEHEAVIERLLFSNYFIPRLVEELFEQVNLKCPYRFEDFIVKYICDSKYIGVLITINNQYCPRFKRIYVMFQPSAYKIETVDKPSYYLVLDEPDFGSTLVYLNEALDITVLHENVQEETEFDYIEEHYLSRHPES